MPTLSEILGGGLTTAATLAVALEQDYVVQKKELKARIVVGVENPIDLVVLG